MKKILIICLFCLMVISCSTREGEIQKLQENFKEVYALNSSIKSEYLCIDGQGNVHLVSISPVETDIVVFYNVDIENAIKRDFNKEDMRQ